MGHDSQGRFLIKLFLFALGAGAGVAQALPNCPVLTGPVRFIFATTASTTGSIGAGGLAGADAFVQADSQQAGSLLAGTAGNMAIVSVTGTNAKDRFVDTGAPVYTTDCVKVAPNVTALWNTSVVPLLSAPSVSVLGGGLNVGIFTGTDASGVAMPQFTCNDWTAATFPPPGQVGSPAHIDFQWLSAGTTPCSNGNGHLEGLTVPITLPPTAPTPTPMLSVASLLGLALLLIGLAALSLRARRRN